MDFYLSTELESLRASVAEFADQVVAPLAHIVDQTGRIPAEIIEKAVDMKLFGLPFAKSYGGSELGYLGLVVAIEEIARVCASTAFVLSGHLGPTEAINLYGSPEQKEQYLAKLVQGEYLCAFAATEPGAGSDMAASSTSARQVDDRWLVNGRKIFVSNADRANIMVITAVTEETGRAKDRLSLLLMPAGIPGFTVGSRYNKLGMRGVNNYEVFFDDCMIPQQHLIGKRGAGYLAVLEILSRTRITAAAISVGTNPTFSGRTRTVEAFVLDTEADLYGQHVAVDFVSRIRGQEKFDSVQDLVVAMEADTDRARAILAAQ